MSDSRVNIHTHIHLPESVAAIIVGTIVILLDLFFGAYIGIVGSLLLVFVGFLLIFGGFVVLLSG